MNTGPAVIALGASAGGLESLKEFFTLVPAQTGFAFIVVQHLSPNFKSLMDEILSQCTDLPIHRIEQETTLSSNAIYLAPPKSQISVNGSQVISKPLSEAPSPPHVIDSLFDALAKDRGSDAIGIIFSGTGSDGTLGALEIVETEGTVLVQSPQTCKFDGMPQSAIRAGAATQVLSVSDIVPRIVALGEELAKRKHYELKQSEPEMQQIFALLRSHQGIDFSGYRFSTVGRRIERRMRQLQMSSTQLYVQELRESDSEAAVLTRELLIGVTSFFRDAEAFKELTARVVPQLFERCEDDCLRVWTAGCSTGEEAISLAVALYEHIVKHRLSKSVKIFATDVNRSAIEFATAASYAPEQLRGFPADKIETYFNLVNGAYILKPFLRRLIIYSVHNVATDPPFTRVDLLSCRNLLIYMQNDLQERVLHQFVFGLKMGGALFLGKCEQPNHASSFLGLVDNTNRIYQKTKQIEARRLTDFVPSSHLGGDPANASLSVRRAGQRTLSPHENTPTIDQPFKELLERFVPCGALISTNLELVHVYGKAHELLKIPPGKTTLDLSKMLPDTLALAVSTACSTALTKDKDVVIRNVQVQIEPSGKASRYDVSVMPSACFEKSRPKYLLVTFTEATVDVAQSGFAPDVLEIEQSTQTTARISTLEEQLASTRETLQNTIEELETANEELQSTNEELMSSNEELQSSNEELHSVNEELYTVNSEYQGKITELSKANKDIDFLLKNSRIGMVFLDRQLRIRRFNQNISAVISLLPHDVGRPLTDLQFNFSHQELMEAIRGVSEGHLNQKNLEIADRGHSYMVTVALFTGMDNELLLGPKTKEDSEEIIVSFIDISLSKETESLRSYRNQSEELAYHILSEVRVSAHKALLIPADQPEKMIAAARFIQQMTENALTIRRDRSSVQSPEVCSLRRVLEDCQVHDRVAAHFDLTVSGASFFVRRDLFSDTIRQVLLAFARKTSTEKKPVQVTCDNHDTFVRIRFQHPLAHFDDSSMLRLFLPPETSADELKPDLGIAVYSARSLEGDLVVTKENDQQFIDFILPGPTRVKLNQI